MLLTLALRNLLRHRRRSLLTGLTMLAGFIVLSFSLGLTEGGYDRIIRLFTDLQTGHVQLLHRDYIDHPGFFKTIQISEQQEQMIAAVPQVQAFSSRIEAGGLLYVSGSTAGAQIIGIDPKKEPEVSSLKERTASGAWLHKRSGYEALLGAKLVETLNLAIGDNFAVIAQAADGSISTDMFTMVGMIKKNQFDDYRMYTDLESLDEFLELQGRRHRLLIKGPSFKESLALRNQLQAAVALNTDEDFFDWRQIEADFVSSMEADKSGNYILFVIIGLVVVLGVLNTVLMSLMERKREFGVLKAIGTEPKQIFLLILLEVLALAGLSCLLGTLGALALNSYFAVHGIKFPEPVEFGGIYIDEMVASADLVVMLAPSALILSCALVAALLPAWQASLVKPSDSMRAR